MGLFSLIGRLRGDQEKLPHLAETVASRSLDYVWPLVQPRLATLGGNELRGYVRARGRSVLKDQIQQVVQFEAELRPGAVDRLFDLATGALVQLIEERHYTLSTLTRTRRRAA